MPPAQYFSETTFYKKARIAGRFSVTYHVAAKHLHLSSFCINASLAHGHKKRQHRFYGGGVNLTGSGEGLAHVKISCPSAYLLWKYDRKYNGGFFHPRNI